MSKDHKINPFKFGKSEKNLTYVCLVEDDKVIECLVTDEYIFFNG